ncbi:MAG: hypothetical protein U9P70_04765, partial [Patescibacteria group bacterium]|nr:hypothetical protein [Patescibacteria group bacterium]
MVIFCSELANSNTVAVLVGALMAGWFGFKQYRSQKIWEKIDERYFKDGIEEFISDLQRIRRTLEHNFYYSLLVLKYYRDLDNKDFLEQFDLKRIKNNNKLSSKIPSSLWITNLFLKNEHFNKVCVNLFASVGAINDYYISDCMVGLDMMIEDPKRIKFTKEETVKKIFKENNQKYKEVHKELGLYVLI